MHTLSVTSQPYSEKGDPDSLKKQNKREAYQPQVQTIVVPIMASMNKNATQSKTNFNKLQ